MKTERQAQRNGIRNVQRRTVVWKKRWGKWHVCRCGVWVVKMWHATMAGSMGTVQCVACKNGMAVWHGHKGGVVTQSLQVVGMAGSLSPCRHRKPTVQRSGVWKEECVCGRGRCVKWYGPNPHPVCRWYGGSMAKCGNVSFHGTCVCKMVWCAAPCVKAR